MTSLMLLKARPQSSVGAYRLARAFGVSRGQSLYRAMRYLLTGRTGRYYIGWRP